MTEEDVEDAPFVERLQRITAVIAKLRSLQSTDERFRYYIAARSAIGGDKYFQAEAALAMHADAPELAVRALTDLAEAYPDDAPTLRLLGRVLDGWGFGDLARLLFERALESSPRETQTWRELMLLAAKEDRSDDFAELQKRYSAAERDERMQQTEVSLNFEMQRRGRDRRIDDSSELQVEVMWDVNYTDIDLHVLEPSGEEVSYSQLTSKRGGRLHDDVTSGFGPETYTLPRMDPGTYEIALEYYAHDDSRLGMQCLVHVIVYVRGERRDFFVPLTGEQERVVVTRVSR
jgi:tetratricopeptide (TPR) repeat protein